MSDSSDTNAFGKWGPIIAIVTALGSGVVNWINANTGDAGGQELTGLTTDAAFGVIGIVREDLQRQIDDLKAELAELQ